jgi:histidinol phosphatase-like PHP family hydrolase
MLKIADFIIGSAHHYPAMAGRKIRDLWRRESVEMEYKTLMALATNPLIDALGHIGGTCRKYHGVSLGAIEMREIIKTATEHGIAIEINVKYHQPFSSFINLCIEEGARITLGSDAHDTTEVGTIVAALSRESRPFSNSTLFVT